MTHTTPAEAGKLLAQLYEKQFGTEPLSITPLAASGSDRQYYRLAGAEGQTVIGTYNANVAENNTFFYFTNLFSRHGIRVPEIIATARDHRSFLQKDLGTTTLFDLLRADGYTPEVKEYYRQSLEQLAKLQWVAGREVDFNQCFAAKHFDEKAIMADLLYFKYYFADLLRLHYDRTALVGEMELMSRELGRIQPQTFMFRDFQSRNIMVHEGQVYFIDYQGGMQGPPQYDIASLLWQAKAQMPDAWKEELLNGYITSLNTIHRSRVDEIHFRRGYSQMVLLRLLQVLGAYGFRGLIEKKPHFLSSIGYALRNLQDFLSLHPHLPAYPELRTLLERISSPEMQQQFATPVVPADTPLQIQINSFSYKKGIPADKSSHGGGFVFDCRGLLNPGRFEQYKYISGQEQSVKDFLEQQTRMPEFLDNVYSLISINIDDYLARGFDHLGISFGCTGGQHRSVYAAERTADYIKNRYGITVQLEHTNKANWLKKEGVE